jgi:predicted double-glycine peptidase
VLLQSDKYSCGALAIVNALRALGCRMPVAAVAKLAGTSPVYGTTISGVKRALRALEYRAVGLSIAESAPTALSALRGHLGAGHPVILSWDRGEHWVAAVGVLGTRVAVADSADSDLVRVMGQSTLARHWREKSVEGHDIFCGIAVVPK